MSGLYLVGFVGVFFFFLRYVCVGCCSSSKKIEFKWNNEWENRMHTDTLIRSTHWCACVWKETHRMKMWASIEDGRNRCKRALSYRWKCTLWRIRKFTLSNMCSVTCNCSYMNNKTKRKSRKKCISSSCCRGYGTLFLYTNQSQKKRISTENN